MENCLAVREVNDAVSPSDAIFVQIMQSHLIETKNSVILKVILLDRTINPSTEEHRPHDEIELTSWLGYKDKVKQKLIDTLKERFQLNRLIIIKDLNPTNVKKRGPWNVLPHHYYIKYDARRKSPVAIDVAVFGADVDMEPYTEKYYLENFPFEVESFSNIARLKGAGEISRRPISVLGIANYVGSVDYQNKPRMNMVLEDHLGYKILVSVFGPRAETLDHIAPNDIVYVRGAMLGSYSGASLTVNDDSLILVNPHNNKHLRVYCVGLDEWKQSKILGEKREGYDLSRLIPTQEDDYVRRELDDVMDENNSLSEERSLVKHQFTCRFLSIDIDPSGGMWRYQCAFRSSPDSLACYKACNLVPVPGGKFGTWVCTQEREDGSLPDIPGESNEEKIHRKHVGHLQHDVIIRTSAKAEIVDDSLAEGQSVSVYLGHRAIEGLFNLTTSDIAKLNNHQKQSTIDHILQNRIHFYAKASSRYVTKGSFGTDDGSRFVVQIDFMKQIDPSLTNSNQI